MRWFVRVTVALTLSAVGVAALTWAGWPRPRFVVPLDLPTAVDYDGGVRWLPARLLPLDAGADSGWRAVETIVPRTNQRAYGFLRDDGRLFGPWQPAVNLNPCGFDRDGRFVAAEMGVAPDGGGPRMVEVVRGYVRYDPQTGRAEAVYRAPGAGVAPATAAVSRDLSTLAVNVAGDPLAFEVYDVPSGRLRSRLAFPERCGTVDPFSSVVGAWEWQLTPDGAQLLLTEGWDGPRRATAAGVEVYDTATGRLVRRIAHPAPPDGDSGPGLGPDVGACGLCVSSDGLVVTFVVAGWIEWGLNSPLLHRDRDRNPVGGAVLATGAPLPPGHPATHAGGREPVVRWVYDRGYFWVGDAAAAAALAVPAGGPGPGYAPLPRGLGPQLERLREYYQFVPGRPAFVFVNGDARSTDDNPWLAWAFARLRRPAVSLPTTRYFYYDGPAADLRPVRGADGHGYTEDPSFAAGPRNLAVLVNHPGEPRATLTLWELPPPRPPWAWSVPAGVALGVLLTAAGVRLRRRRPNRT